MFFTYLLHNVLEIFGFENDMIENNVNREGNQQR